MAGQSAWREQVDRWTFLALVTDPAGAVEAGNTADPASRQVAKVVELDDPAAVEIVVLAQQGDAPG